LSSTLKELEGKVSLIFSNRVLYWIKDKETAAKNMIKLLAKGGDARLNITAIPDLKPNLNDQLKKKVIDIPSIEEQFEF
jgi:trans-aconitate methyltransferase